MDLKQNDILNPEEVSRWLSIPKTTLYKLCNQGEIPCAKIGKHWRFDRLLVENWFKEQTRKRAARRRVLKKENCP
jgi:excisionase family DNA binding protein